MCGCEFAGPCPHLVVPAPVVRPIRVNCGCRALCSSHGQHLSRSHRQHPTSRQSMSLSGSRSHRQHPTSRQRQKARRRLWAVCMSVAVPAGRIAAAAAADLIDTGGRLRVHGRRIVEDGARPDVGARRMPAGPRQRSVGAHPRNLRSSAHAHHPCYSPTTQHRTLQHPAPLQKLVLTSKTIGAITV